MLVIYLAASQVEALLRRAVDRHMKDPLGNDLPVRNAECGAEKPTEDHEQRLLNERHGCRGKPDIAYCAAERSVNRAEHPLL